MPPSPALSLTDRFAGWHSWDSTLEDGTRLSLSTDPAGSVLRSFYEGYDRAFVLEAEKEELDGFQTCLALNGGPDYAALAARFGPYRELVLTLRTPSGALIAGANLAAFAPGPLPDPCVTVNLNYIYVLPAFRRQGWFRRLVDLIADTVPTLFQAPKGAPRPPVLIFLEQNDPLDLSPEDYARDTAHSGLDQFDRLRIWQGLGARLLRFSYAQPPLSDTHTEAQALLYGLLRPQDATLNACVLHRHLMAFFGVSVLKGGDPIRDPVAGPQLAWLERLCQQNEAIDILDPGPLLDALADGQDIPPARSFLDLLPRHEAAQQDPT